MVQLGVSPLQWSKLAAPCHDLLNVSLSCRLVGREFTQQFNQTLWGGQNELADALQHRIVRFQGRSQFAENRRPSKTLTLAGSTLGIITSSLDLPFRLIIHLDHQHDRQVATTGRGTLLRASFQELLCAPSQDLGGGIVV